MTEEFKTKLLLSYSIEDLVCKIFNVIDTWDKTEVINITEEINSQL